MRRAKIVCTLGPAVHSAERLEELIKAGMDVARVNMSHGTHEGHEDQINLVRAAAKKVGKPIAIFADLQGPKIRLGVFRQGPVELVAGHQFTITTRDVPGDVDICSTTHKNLPKDVGVGDTILIDDGNLQLVAQEVTETDVICEVTVGGPVSDHKGINLPGVPVSVPALTEKDEDDLRWALAHDVDMIALSFVRDAKDITRVHEIMTEEGRTIPVIAKIEKPQAVENLHDIIDAFDGFMVARGDLGVELPLEEVPLEQKRIILAARQWAKPVIVATQMLESMISSPRPTRAEASDVANAVLDGADAVMLSGETSIGKYPVQTVKTMARIVDTTEEHGLHRIGGIETEPRTTGGVITRSALDVANRVGAKYLVAFTKTGDTALRLSRLRPRIPILVMTPSEATRRIMCAVWGATTILNPNFNDHEEMVRQMNDMMVSKGMVEVGDVVVIVSGSPLGISGKTNMLQIHRVKPADWWDAI